MTLAPETPCAASIAERDTDAGLRPADHIFGPELARHHEEPDPEQVAEAQRRALRELLATQNARGIYHQDGRQIVLETLAESGMDIKAFTHAVRDCLTGTGDGEGDYMEVGRMFCDAVKQYTQRRVEDRAEDILKTQSFWEN